MIRVIWLIWLVALAFMMTSGTALCRTWEINTTGTGDAPTIQAGIDSAAAGDTVLVNVGTYNEHDIQMKSGVVLTSYSGLWEYTIIDAGGQGRVITCDGVDATGVIYGFTITGGHASGFSGYDSGGGIACLNYSAPEIRMCAITGNTADHEGGGVLCHDHSSPYIEQCFIRENHAQTSGGGLSCSEYSSPTLQYTDIRSNTTASDGAGAFFRASSSPSFTNCTFLNNSAGGLGGGIYTFLFSTPSFSRCMIVFSTDGEAAYVYDDNCIPVFTCCDIYGNQGGDWTGRIADQDSTIGNFSADPLFCDTLTTAEYVEDCSPCLYGNHPWYSCPAHIGNVGPGCGCGEATEPTTWGAIKAMYR
jgi:predicted outer membrane repeat protein